MPGMRPTPHQAVVPSMRFVKIIGGKARQRQILIDKQICLVHARTNAPDVVLGSLLRLLEETATERIRIITDRWLARTYGS